VGGVRDKGTAGFCGPHVCVWCISVVIVEGACVRDFKGPGLCIAD
jgi:hypothetical protein